MTNDSSKGNVQSLHWDNRLAALGDTYGSQQAPTPLPEPYLIAFNPAAAALIDLDPDPARSPEFTAIAAGNRQLPAMAPFAHAYAGHQFGAWVPQLGDGRAIVLGQVRNRRGESWDLQLKGAGKTPYSRFADGRAILRSTIREYLGSEAMAGLGIPTTRALCMVGSELAVYRETRHSAAVLTRLARSHIRFGSFEYLFYRERFDALAPLADHVIEEHFQEAAAEPPGPARYRAWMTAVIARTAELLADWQSVGFCHGVMNTDNMSILGDTLDYGPFAFMDAFDPCWVCNHSDDTGRYAFDRQPTIALWNLGRFVQAILPLLCDDPDTAIELGQQALEDYRGRFDAAYRRRMGAKLGLADTRAEDRQLLEHLFYRMAADEADFTRTFRALGVAAAGDAGPFIDEFTDRDAAQGWLQQWRARLTAEGGDGDTRRARMDAVNPKYILRSHLAERAVQQAEDGHYGEIERLRILLERPFDEQPEAADYARLPPDWARGIVLSCSA